MQTTRLVLVLTHLHSLVTQTQEVLDTHQQVCLVHLVLLLFTLSGQNVKQPQVTVQVAGHAKQEHSQD